MPGFFLDTKKCTIVLIWNKKNMITLKGKYIILLVHYFVSTFFCVYLKKFDTHSLKKIDTPKKLMYVKKVSIL